MYRSAVPASSTPLRPGTCNTQESLGAAGVAARGVEDWRRVGGGGGLEAHAWGRNKSCW